MALEPKGRIRFRPIIETRPGDTMTPGDLARLKPVVSRSTEGDAAEKPSIDALMRQRGRARVWPEASTAAPSSPDADSGSADEWEERWRELRQREFALSEQQRELHEERMLLRAREQQLQRREERLSDGPDKNREHLQAEVAALSAVRQQLEQRNRELETQLAEAGEKNTAASDEPGADEALWNEREAFIEESENALFEKAMALQEQETHLAHLADQLKALAEQLGADWQALAGHLDLPDTEEAAE